MTVTAHETLSTVPKYDRCLHRLPLHRLRYATLATLCAGAECSGATVSFRTARLPITPLFDAKQIDATIRVVLVEDYTILFGSSNIISVHAHF